MINPNFSSVRGDSYAYNTVSADADQYVGHLHIMRQIKILGFLVFAQFDRRKEW